LSARSTESFSNESEPEDAHDSYEAWREGDHDDLVLSVALSCRAGERFLRKPKLATVYSF
jgi:hypothetical protein